MAKTFKNKQIDGSVNIQDNYDYINDNMDALDVDLDDLYAQDEALEEQLVEILNETDLDPNKDPEVTNARNSELHGTFDTVKERMDYTEDFNNLSLHANGDRYVGNTKLADDGQDVDEWSSIVGTLESESSDIKIGKSAIRVSIANASASYIAAAKENIDLDFTKFENGETSDDDDFIFWIMYISNLSAISGTFSLRFSQDSTYSDDNVKRIDFSTGSLTTGWNYLKIQKSDFSTIGTGAWDNIQSMRFSTSHNAGYVGEKIVFQLAQLVKVSTDLTEPNPFQLNGVEEFTINSGEWYVGPEFGRNIIKEMSLEVADISALISNVVLGDFESQIILSRDDGSSSRTEILTMYEDNSNYLRIFATSDTIRVRSVISGTLVDHIGDAVAIVDGDELLCKIVRQGGNVFVELTNIRSGLVSRIYAESVFDGGNFCLSIRDSIEQSFINCGISNVYNAARAGHADVADRLSKQPFCTLTSSATTSVADSTDGIFTWDTPDDEDNVGGMFDPNNPDIITIRESGRYVIVGSVRYEDGTNVTGYRGLRIRVDGATKRFPRLAPSNNDTSVQIVAVLDLDTGDEVKLNPFHTAGTSVNIVDTDQSPYFTVAKIN